MIVFAFTTHVLTTKTQTENREMFSTGTRSHGHGDNIPESEALTVFPSSFAHFVSFFAANFGKIRVRNEKIFAFLKTETQIRKLNEYTFSIMIN